MKNDPRRLRIGVLGCGPIAQAVHLDACRKARNAELYAICDVAEDLRERAKAIHAPQVAYRDYEAMLADPKIDAVLIAIADAFHVPAALQAIEAGKHVLVEKPLGVTVEECRGLADRVRESGLTFQVGFNRRFDPGVSFARDFIRNDLGRLQSISAWYYDSTRRYAMTENLQPPPITSSRTLRPATDPKADRRAYLLAAHGSHLTDTARFLGGPIAGLRARRLERFGALCWFIAVDFADGSFGHLELNVPIRGDFEEGFRVFGEHGSVSGRLNHPWYHKSGAVECFSARDGQFRRVLGEDAHTYKLHIESFSDTILRQIPQRGATLADGLASVQTTVAVARSCELGQHVSVDAVTGGI